MGTRKVATLIVCAAFVAGIALDYFWLAAQVPAFSNAVVVRPGAVFLGAKVLSGFSFGVLVPLLLALIALALVLFPWSHATYPVARQERFRLIRRMALIMLLTPLWILSAGFVYRLVKGYLPAPAATVLESFGFQPTFYYWKADEAHQLLGPIDGSLACFLGLAVGLLLFYYNLPR